MTDKKLTRREAIKNSAGGALSLAAAMALVNNPALAAEDETYSQNEIVNAVVGFFGVTAQAAAGIVNHVFADLGRPNAYIAGEEASGAIAVGLRYGKGSMHRKGFRNLLVYWQGPSVGFDFGGNASKTFTLVYKIRRQEEIFQRFPGVEGTAYYVAGMGVNYQRSGRISLAPIRAGVGFRAGINIGYLSYTRERDLLPF
ncbi:MAG: DUF1134 domain-containing protein [Alphaproteobacteria bacterium]|nr:DUF1134 domain-containing protein [Alphaproteobacteria bacterium]